MTQTRRPLAAPLRALAVVSALAARLAAPRAATAAAAARAWERGQRTALDHLAPEWTEHTPTAYGYGKDGLEAWARTLAVRDWPPRVTAGWLAPLLFDLGGDVTVTQHVGPVPTAEAVTRLRAQRVVQASVAQARLERGAISDPAEQLDLASAEGIAQAVAAGEEALFSVGLYLCLRAPTVAELDALERRVRERLLALGVGLASTRWRQRAGFRTAGVPYAADDLGHRRTLDTTTLALSLPFLASTVGTRDGAAGRRVPRRSRPRWRSTCGRARRAGTRRGCASWARRAGARPSPSGRGPAGT